MCNYYGVHVDDTRLHTLDEQERVHAASLRLAGRRRCHATEVRTRRQGPLRMPINSDGNPFTVRGPNHPLWAGRNWRVKGAQGHTPTDGSCPAALCAPCGVRCELCKGAHAT
eukprot:12135254-Karenia_brevis.AAC.1